MPIDAYYNGSGNKVMQNMKEEYGEDEGKRVFYAIANKKKLNPAGAKRAPKSTNAKRGGTKNGG